MQVKNLLSFVGLLAVIATTKLNVDARRSKLRPLSAPEVYKILKEAGREDAVPEGRVVTQGLAAITGFNLGLTTGIGGALLYDLITVNTTGSSSGNSSTSGVSFITQDICFQSRNLELDELARKAENDGNDESGRQATGSTPTTPTTTNTGSTPTTPTTTNTGSTPTTPTTTNTGSTTPTTSNTATSTPTATIPSLPTTGTPTSPTATNPGPTGNTPTATIPTQPGTGEDQTCITIQKPKARKQRSINP